jgi:hypothetical protein
MERYIRSVLNFTLLVPLLAAWILLSHRYYEKDWNRFFTKPKNITSVQIKSQPIDSQATANVSVEVLPHSNAEIQEDVLSKQLLDVRDRLKRIADFDREISGTNIKDVSPKELSKPAALSSENTETTNLSQAGDAAKQIEAVPEYDETLVELSETQKNLKPLVAKYVNTVFSKNVMRSFKVDGQKVVAIKAESLLANGPRGIVLSKSNLKFLENSFARFKDLYGIAKIVLTTPEEHNSNYIQKITKFAKNYFTYELEVTSDYEGADGFEIILIGEHR